MVPLSSRVVTERTVNATSPRMSRSTGQISENYQSGNQTVETWYQRQTSERNNATGWGALDQPQDEHHNGSSGETGDEAEEENGGE